jgi:hypothetical protein
MKVFNSRVSTIVGLFAAAVVADDLKARIASADGARAADAGRGPRSKLKIEVGVKR